MAIANPIEGTAFRLDGLPPKDQLPTQYDLPSDDPLESGVPDEFHLYQPQLLRETFRPAAVAPEEVFIGADLHLYYDPQHPLWYKRPDWFAVLGQPRAQRQEDLRFSYVIWQEELVPYLVVELLSPGTEDEDLGRRLWDLDKTPGKWVVYERILKVPYYVLYSRYTGVLQAFGRVSASYRPMVLEDERLWLPEAGIGLGIWEGRFEGCAVSTPSGAGCRRWPSNGIGSTRGPRKNGGGPMWNGNGPTQSNSGRNGWPCVCGPWASIQRPMAEAGRRSVGYAVRTLRAKGPL